MGRLYRPHLTCIQLHVKKGRVSTKSWGCFHRMTVIFLWWTVWELLLEDSTSHRFMHPVEWRRRLPRYGALRQEQACLAVNLPRLAQRHSFPRIPLAASLRASIRSAFRNAFCLGPAPSRTSRKVPWSPSWPAPPHPPPCTCSQRGVQIMAGWLSAN